MTKISPNTPRRRTATIKRILLLLVLAGLVAGCGGGHPEASDSPTPEATAHATPRAADFEDRLAAVEADLVEQKFEEAAHKLDEALEVASGPHQQSACYRLRGQIRLARGEHGPGIRDFEEAIRLEEHRDTPDFSVMAGCYNTIGGVYFARREIRLASEQLRKASELLAEHAPQDFAQRRSALTNLLTVHASAGQMGEVEKVKEQLRLLNVEANEPLEEGALLAGWFARVYRPANESLGVRYAHRVQQIDRSVPASRILTRQWPDPAAAEAESGDH